VGEAARRLPRTEAMRVLCPRGKAFLGKEVLTKPLPKDTDDWSHPYHGPDNNPQSKDKIARAPYLTQFLAKPYYGPLTQVAVASAGRAFKAFGNIAFKVREEPLLNTLVAFNGYNGTMLWKRKLTPGVMIHRNTMIAMPDSLYVADDKSCKVIDPQTGRLKYEITPPIEVAGGTFWKWMALEDGVLYTLIGEQEQKDPVSRQRRKQHGWPWMPLSKGFNQPQHPWGFGRNVLAIDPKSKKVLWSHREKEKIDARAMCMKNGRIYFYRHEVFLVCLDAKTGKTVWRKTPDNDPKLFESLGKYLTRQGAHTNWRTTSYLKCSDKALYFAGPMVDKLLALSTKDGTVLWEHPYDNFQLVLRDDGLYGISSISDKHPSMKFDPLTGELLATLDTRRTSCTRPNGTADAIFYRALGGSVRLDIASNTPQWISPMRAQCHDGVTIANGFLYWWPSVCDCQNSLLGVSCLGPAGDFDFSPKATEAERLEIVSTDIDNVADLPQSPHDWPTFRANNLGTVTTEVTVAKDTAQLWWFAPDPTFTPTAPVIVGELAFLGGSDGIVRALDMATGETRWKAYTGGLIRFSPTVWKGRLFVGSGDGWMYVFEAATGRLLWRFRAAPVERRIPVYGSLMSTWPVAGGVLVEDGIAYFAAGIVNYDGTHIYALDAETGKIKWQNNTSGHLNSEARTGVSVQGHMLISAGKLYLAGGNAISPAIYDINDGKCLNDPEPLKLCMSRSARGQELYKVGDSIAVGGMPLYRHPDYPVYNPTVTRKMLHTSADGRDVIWKDNKRIMCFNPIGTALLNGCLKKTPAEPVRAIGGWADFNIATEPLWKQNCEGSVAFVRCKNAVLYAGTAPDGEPCIRALDIQTGEEIWKHPRVLLSSPVAWGMAVDAKGRIVTALNDGQVMCYGPKPKPVARTPLRFESGRTIRIANLHDHPTHPLGVIDKP
jgi:outer membrane protein assembly factor BamB